MAEPGTLRWTLNRYAFRRDVLRKVHNRYTAYRRRAERDPFSDVAQAVRSIHEPLVVLDVGANIGLTTSKLLRVFPLATVHAFEPTAETAAVLRGRLESNGRVNICESAVSDVVGYATFNVDNRTHAGGSNSLLEHSSHFATRARVDRYAPVVVPVTTIDAYAAEHSVDHIDLLKLDIEGAELLALTGAGVMLAGQAIDFIVTEVRFIADYVDQPLFPQLIHHLESLGYSLFNVYAPAESEVRQALFGDAVFVSDKMRDQMLVTYGPKGCGWSG